VTRLIVQEISYGLISLFGKYRLCKTLWLHGCAYSLSSSWFQTFAVFWTLCAFFWVIPRCPNFICQRFGTLCLSHLHRRIGVEWILHLSAYEDGTECSETSAHKIQTPGNYPEENIQHEGWLFTDSTQLLSLSVLRFLYRWDTRLCRIGFPD
jgi:hypothetical protein